MAKQQTSKKQIIEQRQIFENSLKYAAGNLSNHTDVSTLVQLLRVSTFLDNQPLSLKLLGYIKAKMNTLDNGEIASLHSSLVLITSRVDPKVTKMLEYITLRRVHSLESSEITQIINGYAYLCKQQKIELPSSSFVKTFEYIILNKFYQMSINQQANCLISLIELKIATDSQIKLIKRQTLIQLYDKISDSLINQQQSEASPASKTKISLLAELYYQLHRQQLTDSTEEQIKFINSLDFEPIYSQILLTKDFKPKDIFDILQVSDNQEVSNYLVDYVILNIDIFLPEEVIILVNMIDKIQGKDKRASIVMAIQEYLENNIREMDYHEVAKVYMSCIKQIRSDLSQSFIDKIDQYLIENIKKVKAQTLPYVIPLMIGQDIKQHKKQISSQQLQEIVLKTLSQKDFTAPTYILIIGQIIELTKSNKFLTDFEFWRQLVQYVPQLPLTQQQEYISLKACLLFLSDNVKELDFSNLISYIEDVYEETDKDKIAISSDKSSDKSESY